MNITTRPTLMRTDSMQNSATDSFQEARSQAKVTSLGVPSPAAALTTSNITLHDTIWSKTQSTEPEISPDPDPLLTPPLGFRSEGSDSRAMHPRLLSISVSEADSDRSFSSQDTVINRMERQTRREYYPGLDRTNLVYPGPNALISPVPGSSNSNDGSDDTGLSSDIGQDPERQTTIYETNVVNSQWLPNSQSPTGISMKGSYKGNVPLRRSDALKIGGHNAVNQLKKPKLPITSSLPRHIVNDCDDDDGYDSPGGACGSDTSSTESNNFSDIYVTNLPKIQEDQNESAHDQTKQTQQIRILKKIVPTNDFGRVPKTAEQASKRHSYLFECDVKIPSFREMNKTLKEYNQANEQSKTKSESSLEKQLRLLTSGDSVDAESRDKQLNESAPKMVYGTVDQKDSLVSKQEPQFRSIISRGQKPKNRLKKRVRFADPIMTIAPEDRQLRNMSNEQTANVPVHASDMDAASWGRYSFKDNQLLYSTTAGALMTSSDDVTKTKTIKESAINNDSQKAVYTKPNSESNEYESENPGVVKYSSGNSKISYSPDVAPHAEPHVINYVDPSIPNNDTSHEGSLYIKPEQTKDILHRLTQMKRNSIAANSATSLATLTGARHICQTGSLCMTPDVQHDCQASASTAQGSNANYPEHSRTQSAFFISDDRVDHKSKVSSERPPDYIHPPVYHSNKKAVSASDIPSTVSCQAHVPKESTTLQKQARPQFASSADIYSLLHRSSKNPFGPGGSRFNSHQNN